MRPNNRLQPAGQALLGKFAILWVGWYDSDGIFSVASAGRLSPATTVVRTAVLSSLGVNIYICLISAVGMETIPTKEVSVLLESYAAAVCGSNRRVRTGPALAG